MNKTEKEIHDFVKKAKHRLAANVFLNALFIYLAAGLAVGTVINFIALFVPFYYSIAAACAAIFIALIIGIIYSIIKSPNTKKAALIVDGKGLEERLTTALELEGSHEAISELQKEDAVEAIKGFSIKEKIPIRTALLHVALMVMAAVTFTISAILPSPAKEEAVKKHEVSKEAETEKEKIEKAQEEIEKIQNLDSK